MPASPVPWGARHRSQTDVPDRRCRGRASRRQPTGRSAPGTVNRRLVQMTGGPAAGPGSPAARRYTAPSRRQCPHLAAAHSTGPHTAVVVIGKDEVHAGLPQQCLPDRPAHCGGRRRGAIHADHYPSLGAVGSSSHRLLPVEAACYSRRQVPAALCGHAGRPHDQSSSSPRACLAFAVPGPRLRPCPGCGPERGPKCL
jgi:hypothetical protein